MPLMENHQEEDDVGQHRPRTPQQKKMRDVFRYGMVGITLLAAPAAGGAHGEEDHRAGSQPQQQQSDSQHPQSHPHIDGHATHHHQSSGGAGTSAARTLASSQQEAATIYTCPMHPEVRQTEPGVCPKCGMTLEPQKLTPDGEPTGQQSSSPQEPGTASKAGARPDHHGSEHHH